MYRTPAKKPTTTSPPGTPPRVTQMPEADKAQTNVRRSVGEWEAGRAPPTEGRAIALTQTAPEFTKECRSAAPRTSLEGKNTNTITSRASRVQEARACLAKAKMAINASRNLRTDIKADVTQAIERLYQLVKEGEIEKGQIKEKGEKNGDKTKGREGEEEGKEQTAGVGPKDKTEVSQLLSSLSDHSRLMRESNERILELKIALENKRDSLERITYASVAATAKTRQIPEQIALHSVVVTSRDETETGEAVIQKIRMAVNAKEAGIKIDKVRKAKDRKVIVSCRDENEIDTVKRKLEEARETLKVDNIKNKDPLVILKDVFSYNTKEDVLKALRVQNDHLFKNLQKPEDRVDIKFTKPARNPHTRNIVVAVSPVLWARMLEAGSVHIDLQRVRVADQSPLTQCSLCLGYGHGRRFCKETLEKCSHCTGPHKKADCPEWIAGASPKCCNCSEARLDQVTHNAFSDECPVRRKWDALARATTAYC